MFETNFRQAPEEVETLESRLMKELFGLDAEPAEITKDVVILMVQTAFEKVVSLRDHG